MPTCPVNKVDSSATGLRIAREACYKELSSNPILRPFEPNSYNDFGGQPVYTARNPINASRQNQRGRITNKDSAAGFSQDLTMDVGFLLPGFMFAEARVKPCSRNWLLEEQGNLVQSVTVAGGVATVELTSALAGVDEGSILQTEGFSHAQNNGVFVVASVTGSAIQLTAPNMVAEAAPLDTALVRKVGHRFGTGDVSLSPVAGGLPVLSLGLDPETLGLIPGEWIFVGGDDANTFFPEEANNGWMRINRLLPNGVELDKTDGTIVEGTGSGLTVEIYLGTVYRNEKDKTLIKPISYHLERSLGRGKDDVLQGEYVNGCIANELQLQMPTADKITVDLTYLAAMSGTYRDVEGGGYVEAERPEIQPQHAFNSTSDVNRLRIMVNDPVTSNPIPEIGYISEASVTVNNGANGLGAVGQMGFFDTSTGNFTVGGSVTTYFTDVTAVALVHQGADVTLDFSIVYENHGYLVDIPALNFSEGRLAVEMGSPITLPLTASAYENKFGNTLTIMQFHYLPDSAETY